MMCFALATRITAAQSAMAWGTVSLALLLAACQPAPGTVSGTAEAEKQLQLSHSAATILPLQRGYYVANDTPCAKVRIPLMADSDSISIADSVPCDGGHVARVS